MKRNTWSVWTVEYYNDFNTQKAISWTGNARSYHEASMKALKQSSATGAFWFTTKQVKELPKPKLPAMACKLVLFNSVPFTLGGKKYVEMGNAAKLVCIAPYETPEDIKMIEYLKKLWNSQAKFFPPHMKKDASPA